MSEQAIYETLRIINVTNLIHRHLLLNPPILFTNPFIRMYTFIKRDKRFDFYHPARFAF